MCCALSHSFVSDSLWPHGQTPLSMEFPRKEFWRELSFPTPEDLPKSEIDPMFLASPALAGKYFSTVPPGKPHSQNITKKNIDVLLQIYLRIIFKFVVKK